MGFQNLVGPGHVGPRRLVSRLTNPLLRVGLNCLPLKVRPLIGQIPGIGWLQRQVIARLLGSQCFVHVINVGPAKGLTLEVTLPRDKAMWMGVYELEFSIALGAAVRPGDVCYDIGAYRGYMAGVMALAGARSVLAFEPLPTNVAALSRFNDLNPKLPIRVRAAAVGASDGQSTLKLMADASMGKLSASSFQADRDHEGHVAVEGVKIDTIVFGEGEPPPDVLKIDVEGSEVAALQGALGVIAKYRPTIFIEVHSQELERDCVSTLEPVGYRAKRLTEGTCDTDYPIHLIAIPA